MVLFIVFMRILPLMSHWVYICRAAAKGRLSTTVSFSAGRKATREMGSAGTICPLILILLLQRVPCQLVEVQTPRLVALPKAKAAVISTHFANKNTERCKLQLESALPEANNGLRAAAAKQSGPIPSSARPMNGARSGALSELLSPVRFRLM